MRVVDENCHVWVRGWSSPRSATSTTAKPVYCGGRGPASMAGQPAVPPGARDARGQPCGRIRDDQAMEVLSLVRPAIMAARLRSPCRRHNVFPSVFLSVSCP